MKLTLVLLASLILTQSHEPAVPVRLSLKSGCGMDWSWLHSKDAAPKGGLIAVCGEPIQCDKCWFVHTDGLYLPMAVSA